MANPQKENGHLDLANEIVEILAKTQLSGHQWRILMAVFRKTYGWHKKEDWISFSQFSEITNLRFDSDISNAIKELVKRRILIKNTKSYKFNKNYEEWLAKSLSGVSEITKKKLVKTLDTKEKPKETITKTNNTNVLVAKPHGNAELNELVKYADELHFVLQGTLQANRFSAFNCLKKFGLDGARKLVAAAVSCRGKPYSPTINDFTALYRKAGDLATYYAKNKPKQGKNYDE